MIQIAQLKPIASHFSHEELKGKLVKSKPLNAVDNSPNPVFIQQTVAVKNRQQDLGKNPVIYRSIP